MAVTKNVLKVKFDCILFFIIKSTHGMESMEKTDLCLKGRIEPKTI